MTTGSWSPQAGGEGLLAADRGADHPGQDELEVAGAGEGRVAGVDQRRRSSHAYGVRRWPSRCRPTRQVGLERDRSRPSCSMVSAASWPPVSDGAQDRRHRDRVGAPVVDPAPLPSTEGIAVPIRYSSAPSSGRVAVAHRDRRSVGDRTFSFYRGRAGSTRRLRHRPGRRNGRRRAACARRSPSNHERLGSQPFIRSRLPGVIVASYSRAIGSR